MIKKISTDQVVNYSHIIYYNDDHSKTIESIDKISSKLKLTYSLPSSWNELSQELENNASYLIFHVDMISKSMNSSPREFINAILTLYKYISNSNDLKIGVVIKPTTSRSVIHELQQNSVQGILLDLNHYDVDSSISCYNAFVNNIPYWPKNVIDNLPDHSNRPFAVYFREGWNPYSNYTEQRKFERMVNMSMEYCLNWNEFGDSLNKRPHQIVFHISTIERLNTTIPEIINMIKTRLKIVDLDISMGVIVEPTTSSVVVKELKRSGIRGIIPSASHWGINECVTAIHALRDGSSYWPKHIIDTLSGNVKKETSKNQVVLTERQSQVFKLITERGLSNKLIARSLGISESTVKLHVTEIFKKYGVTTRTQLAVFSNISEHN